ncbi:MAG TPA: hypothetical protein VLW52_15080 [Opitutaceae bacterium]|nr:hypothetical protein [Opitutaceae bacterium]
MASGQSGATAISVPWRSHRGATRVDAYRIAYKKRGLLPQSAKRAAKRIHQNPAIKHRIRELQGRLEVRATLSLNDRLAILARVAQARGGTAPMIHARAHAIEVYSNLARDRPVERSEVTVKGDAAAHRPTKQESASAIIARHEDEKPL